jgi:hypothetical protein
MKLTKLPRFKTQKFSQVRGERTGEDRSLLRVNEDRSQAFNNEID